MVSKILVLVSVDTTTGEACAITDVAGALTLEIQVNAPTSNCSKKPKTYRLKFFQQVRNRIMDNRADRQQLTFLTSLRLKGEEEKFASI